MQVCKLGSSAHAPPKVAQVLLVAPIHKINSHKHLIHCSISMCMYITVTFSQFMHLSLQHLQYIKVNGKKVAIQHLQESLMDPASHLGILGGQDRDMYM